MNEVFESMISTHTLGMLQFIITTTHKKNNLSISYKFARIYMNSISKSIYICEHIVISDVLDLRVPK